MVIYRLYEREKPSDKAGVAESNDGESKTASEHTNTPPKDYNSNNASTDEDRGLNRTDTPEYEKIQKREYLKET